MMGVIVVVASAGPYAFAPRCTQITMPVPEHSMHNKIDRVK